MDQAEKDRLRALIKAKQDELDGKLFGNGATRTPERDAEAKRVFDEVASRIRVTQTGPNDYAITAVDEVEVESRPRLPNPFSEEAGLFFRGRLTKSIMFALPEGVVVQSNTYSARGIPVAVEQVGNLESREELWKRFRSLKVSNITCNVWRDWEAYHRFNGQP